MANNIEHIVNEQGKRIKAIVPLNLMSKVLTGKKSKSKNLSRKKLKKYAGSIKLKKDPLKYQKDIRSEWE
jgi:hypothetical protein